MDWDSESDASVATRLLLEKNDPKCIKLTIRKREDYWPSNAREWRKRGESIAHNTYSKKLTYCTSPVSNENVPEEDVEGLFCDIAKNSSIQTLRLWSIPLRRKLFKILVQFFVNNHNFEDLGIEFCACESTHLASTLSQFSSLKEFTFCNEERHSDGQLRPIIDVLASHSGLRKLHLHGTCNGESAFAGLATLLQNTQSKLISLVLSNASINNQEVAALATGLTSNSVLRELNLNNNLGITETG